MKFISSTLTKVAVAAMLLVFIYILYQQSQTPEAVVALRERQQLESMRQWHEVKLMAIDALVLILWSVVGGLSLTFVAGGLLAVVTVRNKAQRIYARDGLFPVIVQKHGKNQLAMNPNMWALQAATVTVAPNGETALNMGTNGFSHQDLLTMHGGQQQIQRSLTRGRVAAPKSPNKWEVLERNNLLPKPRDYGQAEANVIDATPTYPRLDAPVDALVESAHTGSFIMGQADDGSLYKLNMRTAAHIAILGATGCGKTVSSGYLLALEAISQNYQTIILDPKGGMDWRVFGNIAEWNHTDGDVFLDQMALIYEEYKRRETIAAREDVSHVAELGDPSLPPLLVIIEEYGALVEDMERKSDRDVVGEWMKAIVRKGRSSDVHLVLIDQLPDQWHPQVNANVKERIIYKVGPNQGNIVGAWKAQALPNQGRFITTAGIEYNAWHVKPDLPKLLPVIQRKQATGNIKRYPMLIDGSYTVVDNGTAWDSNGTAPQERIDVSQVSQWDNGGVCPSPNASVDPSSTVPNGTWDSLTDEQIAVVEYTRANPDSSCRQCERDTGVPKSNVSRYRNELADLIWSNVDHD